MKRIYIALLFFACSAANAQFVTGQILTAAQLNAAFANVLSNSGGTLTGPLTVQGITTVGSLTVNGTFTVSGGFGPGSLSPQAANTVLANVTGASASPAAVAIPSCSATNSAIKYTSGTGWGCGTTFGLTSGTLAQFAATTSAQLAGVVSDESGSGSLLFGTSPTIATPAITGGTITSTPISGSTGSFTTLAASSTVSGAGFTSLLSPYAPLASPTFTGTPTVPGYLTTASATSTYAPIASPTFTGTVTIPSGASISGFAPLASPTFTGTVSAAALTTTGLITPTSTIGIKGTTTNDSPATGSQGESNLAQAATVTTPSGTATNVTSVSLTAGDYFVWGVTQTNPAVGTVTSGAITGISTASGGFTTVGGITNVTSLNYTMPASQGLEFSTPFTHLKLSATTTVYLVAQITYSTSTLTTSGYISWFRAR